MVYDIKALAAINERFIFAHLALTDSDVAHANHLNKLIEALEMLTIRCQETLQNSRIAMETIM